MHFTAQSRTCFELFCGGRTRQCGKRKVSPCFTQEAAINQALKLPYSNWHKRGPFRALKLFNEKTCVVFLLVSCFIVTAAALAIENVTATSMAKTQGAQQSVLMAENNDNNNNDRINTRGDRNRADPKAGLTAGIKCNGAVEAVPGRTCCVALRARRPGWLRHICI